ncbi:MAG: hypothetical protein LBS01_09980 [Prevotellaceae bacterium]|jgi:hypothetical protein|nr:hypothetical protein [Prevotellaceae bacterium]
MFSVNLTNKGTDFFEQLYHPEIMEQIIKILGFLPKENSSGIFEKKYTDGYAVEIDFEKIFVK